MKNKLLNNRSTFYCFTPTVSFATFLIEFILAIYVVARYKMNKFNLIAVSIILLLGLFQFSEYMICKSNHVIFWGQIGIASITMLPILGLHLITIITKKSKLLFFGYIVTAVIIFSIFFLSFLNNFICTDKFVGLNYENPVDMLYTIYYFSLLIVGLVILLDHLRVKEMHTQEQKWMVAGYLSFILPTAFIFIFSNLTHFAIPSVMCGFAILFALILTFKAIPGYNKNNKNREK
ncbi:MAG TPA: hypothetical protein VM077_05085 [Candidatus Limnocylindrales bacterium]|nr:hypothetical protein [Candidatus Limnocylindrales bacterium]